MNEWEGLNCPSLTGKRLSSKSSSTTETNSAKRWEKGVGGPVLWRGVQPVLSPGGGGVVWRDTELPLTVVEKAEQQKQLDKHNEQCQKVRCSQVNYLV